MWCFGICLKLAERKLVNAFPFFSRMEMHRNVLGLIRCTLNYMQRGALSIKRQFLRSARKERPRTRVMIEIQYGPLSTLAYPGCSPRKPMGLMKIYFEHHLRLTCEMTTVFRVSFEDFDPVGLVRLDATSCPWSPSKDFL